MRIVDPSAYWHCGHSHTIVFGDALAEHVLNVPVHSVDPAHPQDRSFVQPLGTVIHVYVMPGPTGVAITQICVA